MLERLIPWKFIIRHITKSYGLIDPFSFLARLRRFSQPSEVQEPLELLRAGIVFHARGLINTRVIQNNLDWVWPFWVEKQFNPRDPSFIPRAYSLTHINLSNRNWTAVGLPHLPIYPIADPRGLVTPLYDGWSLDFWVFGENGSALIPSRLDAVDQTFVQPDLTLQTDCRAADLAVCTNIRMENEGDHTVLKIHATAGSAQQGRLVISLRPYNPEGVQFIERVNFDKETNTWLVDSKTPVQFSRAPDKICFSTYEKGDVIHYLEEEAAADHVVCPTGMATSAAVFMLAKDRPVDLDLTILLDNELDREKERPLRSRQPWKEALSKTPELTIPDEKIVRLFDSAKKTLILLSADDVFPGPYTYRRFWFRDACLMINALLSLGLKERCVRLLENFFPRQKYSGYFESQEGEWDSNGQVLWIFDRFYQFGGASLFQDTWLDSLYRAGMWIVKKRLPKDGTPHGGLLPAGFSAEHLGPNDYYYWDDFWGLAGLKAIAHLAGVHSDPRREAIFEKEAGDFEQTLLQSINDVAGNRTNGSIPASPYRRMDSGAIGSLVADYPLRLLAKAHPLIKKTVDYLMENCLVSGCFFQDMIHSGMNPYLTMAMAQSLLRLEDSRFQYLIEKTAALASPTGHWPEAVHPFSGGGCMGDGQHGWAAAEWVQIITSLFVREEENQLVLGAGIFPTWIETGSEIAFGPVEVSFGTISIRMFRRGEMTFFRTDTKWHRSPELVEIRVPGFVPAAVTESASGQTITALSVDRGDT